MAFLDLVLGAFLVYGVFKGFRNGFFVELASLLSFVIGIYIAVKFSYLLQDSVGSHLPGSSKTVQVVAFVATFLLVVIGITLLAKAFTKIADFAFLGCVNRMAGGAVGMLRMMLFLGIVLGLLLKFDAISAQAQQKSVFFRPFLRTSEFILPVLKHWFEDLKAKTT